MPCHGCLGAIDELARDTSRRIDGLMFQIGEAEDEGFLLGCVAALVIAIAGMEILNRVQEPVAQAFATSAVRL